MSWPSSFIWSFWGLKRLFITAEPNLVRDLHYQKHDRDRLKRKKRKYGGIRIRKSGAPTFIFRILSFRCCLDGRQYAHELCSGRFIYHFVSGVFYRGVKITTGARGLATGVPDGLYTQHVSRGSSPVLTLYFETSCFSNSIITTPQPTRNLEI